MGEGDGAGAGEYEWERGVRWRTVGGEVHHAEGTRA